ncbi:hypothetical protein SGFS_045790 [Streptomyces graminofaciens]|uniref:TadE-like domain-containing protein n=1 Tax=Streptomyces graminofaciens TaxID=68212 RepID=A0ABM7FB68_9ACTN|nr:TadE family protein [Streptomyces graminofaciens]BBC33285.1 hypothetical protein SGFS_045790 [Streptomyces graminofaciens]
MRGLVGRLRPGDGHGRRVRPAYGRRPRSVRGHPAPSAHGRRLRADRGAAILEFAGFLPILMLVALGVIQLGLVGYGVNQAGTAARAAARAASLGEDGVAAGQASVSGWLNPEVDAPGGGGETTTATVVVTVPSILPLLDIPTIERSATMPNDNDNDNDD